MFDSFSDRLESKIAALVAFRDNFAKSLDGANLMYKTLDTTKKIAVSKYGNSSNIVKFLAEQVADAHRIVTAEWEKKIKFDGRIEQCREFFAEDVEEKKMADIIDRLQPVIDALPEMSNA